MKRFLIVVFLLGFCTPVFAKTYTVEKVIDGCTLQLTNGEEVRLIGLDCAKMGQEATEFVKGLLIKLGQEVRLEFDIQKKDKYQRLLAYVYTTITCGGGNGPIPMVLHGSPVLHKKAHNVEIHLNEAIIKSGYATPMTIPPNVKHAELFQKLYEGARENKMGWWSTLQSDWVLAIKNKVNLEECGSNNCEACDTNVCNNYKDSCKVVVRSYACGPACDAVISYCVSKKNVPSKK